MRMVSLTRGRVALVDDADFERLAKYRWGFDTGYAARRGPRPARRKIYMHRDVLGLGAGDPRLADHINGDRLDNRRSNLRVLDLTTNPQNQHANRGATSRFRGVSWSTLNRRWVAQAKCNGLYFHQFFDDEVEAAKAAQAWRNVHMPFAAPDPELLALLDREPAQSGKAAA